MPATQPGRVLVQPVDVAAEVVDTRWRSGERGADGVVAASAVLCDAAVLRFVAGIHARRAADGEKNDEGVFQVSGVLQLAGDPGDVVVPDERHRDEVVEKLVVP